MISVTWKHLPKNPWGLNPIPRCSLASRVTLERSLGHLSLSVRVNSPLWFLVHMEGNFCFSELEPSVSTPQPVACWWRGSRAVHWKVEVIKNDRLQDDSRGVHFDNVPWILSSVSFPHPLAHPVWISSRSLSLVKFELRNGDSKILS